MEDDSEKIITIVATRKYRNTKERPQSVILSITKAPNVKSDYTVKVTDLEFYPFFNTIVETDSYYFLKNNEYDYTIEKGADTTEKIGKFLPRVVKPEKKLQPFQPMQCVFEENTFYCTRSEENGEQNVRTPVTLTICKDNSRRTENDIDQLSEVTKYNNGTKLISFDLLDVEKEVNNMKETVLKIVPLKNNDHWITYTFVDVQKKRLDEFLLKRDKIIRTKNISPASQVCLECAIQMVQRM